MVGGPEFAADHAVPVPDSEDEKVSVVASSEQGLPRGAVDDLSAHDAAGSESCSVRHRCAHECIRCRCAARARWIAPRFLRAPGMHHYQVATTGLCFQQGEGDMGGSGINSFAYADDDLPEV